MNNNQSMSHRCTEGCGVVEYHHRRQQPVRGEDLVIIFIMVGLEGASLQGDHTMHPQTHMEG
jgi:hypothetical protein